MTLWHLYSLGIKKNLYLKDKLLAGIHTLIAFMHQSNSSMKAFARELILSASRGVPFSSKVLSTFGTGKRAGTVHAFIFQRVNCNEIRTWLPPIAPSETVEIAIGFLFHSSYNKSVTFFRLAGMDPLYSGVTIIKPSESFILWANSRVLVSGFF